MPSPTNKKTRDVSSIIFFAAATALGCYLIYLAIIIPWEIGREQGQIRAAFRPARAVVDEGDQVFNMRELYIATPELINLGRAVYNANCASCHGPEGFGDGAAGRGLAIRPRNFHELEGWKIGTSVLNMYESLVAGVAPAMPAFRHLNPRQKFAVTHFIHHEFMSEIGWAEDPPEAIAALPGVTEVVEVNIDPWADERIPVDVAIMRLLAELENQ